MQTFEDTLVAPLLGKVPENEAREIIQLPDVLDEEKVAVELVSIQKAIKTILKISSGTITLQLLKGMVPFSGSIFLSRINNDVRAAATLINTVEDFCSMIFNSPTFYIATAVGELNDGKKKQEIGGVAQAGWLLALGCSIPQVILMIFVKPILEGCKQSPEIASISNDFFKIYLFAAPLLAVQSVSDSIAQATKNIYSPVIIQAISLGSSIFLSYMLVNGKFGLPKLGARGVAWSLLSRAILNCLTFHVYLLFSDKTKRNFAQYNIFKRHKNILTKLKKLTLKGLPLFVVFLFEVGGMYLANMLVGGLGKEELSAQLVISQYQDFLLIPTGGIGIAAQIIVSNELGKNNQSNVLRYGNVAISLSLIIPAIYTLFSIIAPKIVMSPFIDVNDPGNHYPVAILDKQLLLVISGISSMFNAVRMVSSMTLIGTKNIGLPVIANMIVGWVGAGIGYGFAYKANWGAVGMNLGLTIGWWLSATTQYIYWLVKARDISSTKAENKKRHREENVEEGSKIDDKSPYFQAPKSSFFNKDKDKDELFTEKTDTLKIKPHKRCRCVIV